MLFNIFASSNIHVSLKAEPLFSIGPLNITNAILYGALVSFCIAFLMIWAARKISIKSNKGFSQIIEILVEFILGVLEGALGSRANAVKYAPVFGVYFLFIIFTNLSELLPIVGTTLTATINGTNTPLFRPFTADLNGTIALSVVAIIMIQIMSIKKQGGKKHLQHYFSDKPYNPINFFIGLLEVFGEFTRILSLSLRLFLNTAVGEILLAVFTSIFIANGRTPLVVLPILLFEVLVAAVQAYVFTILAATYLGLAISHSDSHNDEHRSADTLNKVESREAHGV